MSDLTRYTRSRAARDPEFAEGLEAGYEAELAELLAILGSQDLTDKSKWSEPIEDPDEYFRTVFRVDE
jgi:hypothetical protein